MLAEVTFTREDLRGVRTWRAVQVPYPKFDSTRNCHDIGPSSFYSPDPEEYPSKSAHQEAVREVYAWARVICSGCPFRDECAEYGIAHESEGVWGGLSPSQRREIRRQRGQRLVTVEEITTVFGNANNMTQIGDVNV